ncbi:hypothetical protein ACJX0J_041721, partial [Zea mays]
ILLYINWSRYTLSSNQYKPYNLFHMIYSTDLEPQTPFLPICCVNGIVNWLWGARLIFKMKYYIIDLNPITNQLAVDPGNMTQWQDVFHISLQYMWEFDILKEMFFLMGFKYTELSNNKEFEEVIKNLKLDQHFDYLAIE